MGKEKNPGRGKNRIEFKKGTINIMKKLEEYVISIPDFPEPGIIFRDITTIYRIRTDCIWQSSPCRTS